MLFDIILLLNEKNEVEETGYGSIEVQKTFAHSLKKGEIFSAGDTPLFKGQGKMTLPDGHLYQWQAVSVPKRKTLLLLKKDAADRLEMMEHSFNRIAIGVQIYAKDGTAVFFNDATRRISGIPAGAVVEGKKLSELYDDDPSYSSVLTAIETGLPVINRIANIRPRGSEMTMTVNNAFPIFRDSEVIGAVVFDLDQEHVDRELHRLQASRHAFDHFSKEGNLDIVASVSEAGEQKTLQERLDNYEKGILEEALLRNHYHISNTAKELGLMRQSLQYRMKKFGLGRMSGESGL